MRVTINLATRTHLDQRLIRRWLIAVMAVMALLIAWNVVRLSSRLGEVRRLNAEIAAFEEKLNSRPAGVTESDFNRLLGGIAFYNGVIERKTYNWLGLLEQVENATPEGIALTALTPEKKNSSVKIDGRAKSFDRVRAYVEKLEDSRQFSEIILVSHAETTVGERTRAIQFSISCRKVKP